MVSIKGNNEGYERHQVIYAADNVMFGWEKGVLHVLLIRRSDDSDAFPGAWALPGGCVEPDETALAAARRECEEETGVNLSSQNLDFVGLYDEPGRDPRGRVVSAAYTTTLPGLPRPTAADDAAEARWMPYATAVGTRLAFDHNKVLHAAYRVATG